MSSCDDKPSRPGFFAIDIERTGPNYFSDVTFAIGYAYGPESPSDDSEITYGQVILDLTLDLDFEHLESLSKEDKISIIREKWSEKSFSLKTYDEFWSKNIDVLIQSQKTPEKFRFEAQMANAFNSILEYAESRFSDLIIVSDTIAFDTTHVNNILAVQSHQPLNYSRKGEYRSGVEVDSFAFGALGLPIGTPWSEYINQFNQKIYNTIAIYSDHDHQAKNDAKHILLTFLKTQKYLKDLKIKI